MLVGRGVRVYFDQGHDPVRNLAREEELFRRMEAGDLPEVVRFWVNSECLVKGRSRSARYGWYREEMAEKLGVRVVERATGGGVVYHDEGNLNWSLFYRTAGAFPSPTRAFSDASKYVVSALGRLGVEARFSPPNRLDVDGRKVSGMAARSTAHALLVHGTLLLNSNLERLNFLCIPPAGCPPVANVNEWVKDIDASKVVRALVEALEESGAEVQMGKDSE
jgi:lipoate-protein ligase A